MPHPTVFSSQLSVHQANLDETRTIARNLAKTANKGDCYCLVGDLGAGKTEFARAFIQELCGDIKVGSPTFNIVQVYQVTNSNLNINHFDLYRIKNEAELEEIGLEEALVNSITLIEWPQIAVDILPPERIEISLEIIDELTRRIEIRNNK